MDPVDVGRDMNVRLVRLFGYFGVIAPIFGFSVIFLAIRMAPWFSWTGNALSDLGVEGLSAVVFNNGLGMTAALMAVFSLGVYELAREDAVGRASFVFLVAAAVFLVGIGVFPETAGPIHFYFSVAFFVSLPLALMAFALYAYRMGMRRFTILSVAVGAAAALVWAPKWGAAAIPEALSALALGIWSAVLGVWMTRREEEWD